jgi:hypothetical protein
VALRVLLLAVYPLISTATFHLSNTFAMRVGSLTTVEIVLSVVAALVIVVQLYMLCHLMVSVARNRKQDTPLTRYTIGTVLLHLHPGC